MDYYFYFYNNNIYFINKKSFSIMSYRLAKILLKKYINISFLCKTIELVTILTLQLYKNKILSSQKIIKLFFCFLKENYKNNFLSLNHLVVPIFTDKSCSGIINNLLWANVKELFVLSLYQNVIISFLGTSLKFKKNLVLTSYSKSIVLNFNNLSDETVNYNVSFMLLKEIIFLEYDYFFFYFNEFVNIYNQVVNYYLIRSLQELISLYLYNNVMFLFNYTHCLINNNKNNNRNNIIFNNTKRSYSTLKWNNNYNRSIKLSKNKHHNYNKSVINNIVNIDIKFDLDIWSLNINKQLNLDDNIRFNKDESSTYDYLINYIVDFYKKGLHLTYDIENENAITYLEKEQHLYMYLYNGSFSYLNKKFLYYVYIFYKKKISVILNGLSYDIYCVYYLNDEDSFIDFNEISYRCFYIYKNVENSFAFNEKVEDDVHEFLIERDNNLLEYDRDPFLKESLLNAVTTLINKTLVSFPNDTNVNKTNFNYFSKKCKTPKRFYTYYANTNTNTNTNHNIIFWNKNINYTQKRYKSSVSSSYLDLIKHKINIFKKNTKTEKRILILGWTFLKENNSSKLEHIFLKMFGYNWIYMYPNYVKLENNIYVIYSTDKDIRLSSAYYIIEVKEYLFNFNNIDYKFNIVFFLIEKLGIYDDSDYVINSFLFFPESFKTTVFSKIPFDEHFMYSLEKEINNYEFLEINSFNTYLGYRKKLKEILEMFNTNLQKEYCILELNIQYSDLELSLNKKNMYLMRDFKSRNKTITIDNKKIKFNLKKIYVDQDESSFLNEQNELFSSNKYQESFFLQEEKKMIIDCTLNDILNIYRNEVENQMEKKNTINYYIELKNKTNYLFYADDSITKLFCLGEICILNLEKNHVIFNSTKYFFYRVFYINSQFIDVTLIYENETERIYNSDCPILIKYFFFPFSKLPNLNQSEYERLCDKIWMKPYKLIKKSKLIPIYKKFCKVFINERKKNIT